MMEILSVRTLWGPNLYHQRPVLILKIDLQEWTDVSSTEIPRFKENLLNLLPDLQTHECSVGKPGGFCERLDRGTYMAHIIEHVSLELSVLSGIGVDFGKARYAGKKGQYQIITRFTNESGMSSCLEEAFLLVRALLENKTYDLAAGLGRIQDRIQDSVLGPSTQALIREARRRDIPVRRLLNNSLFQLGYGKKRRFLQAAVTDRTNLIATEILQDKECTKSLLSRAAIPTPAGVIVRDEEKLEAAIRDLRFPLVVKPHNGHHGQGVELDLRTLEDVKAAFRRAQHFSRTILVEEMCEGRDYRILVVDGKMVAAAERRPPIVFGDGFSSIFDLIGILNSDPRRGEGHENILSKIELDEVLTAHLARHSLCLDSIPAKGQEVRLRGNANLSSGGTAHDRTDSVHPEVRSLCERAARLLNIDICGIDLIHQDLSLPPSQGLFVIEMNAGPGLRMHLHPITGQTQPVAEKIIDMLYPAPETGRIPILSVTGTNGKTTVARMIRKILSTSGQKVGLTTTEGIWVGDELILKGDTTGPVSTEMVLSDPTVETAVLEVARGGILRGGLSYDWSDVSIITNIRHDHLGQDGIEDLDDLIWIKSLVAERVREGGWLILNADDPASGALKDAPAVQRVPKNILLYSTTPSNPRLLQHLLEGAAGCWCEDGVLYLQKDGILSRLASVEDLPVTLKGKAQFQVSNALAAMAGAFCMGASLEQIRRALKAFSVPYENSGRLNFYQVGAGYVLLDYAHNPEALRAITRMAREFGSYRITLVASLPGDRSDRLLQESAQVIAHACDRLIVKEEEDSRGRAPQAVCDLILQTVAKENPALWAQYIPDEAAATRAGLENLTEKDLVIVLQDNLEPILSLLRQYDPVPIEHPPFRSEKAQLRTSSRWNERVHHA